MTPQKDSISRAQIKKEQSRIRNARYRAAHPERLKEQQDRFKINNPEKALDIKRRWNEVHRVAKKEKEAIRYQKNREVILARSLQWQRDNPEKVLAREQRRRAREANVPISDLTAQQWNEIKESYDHRCAYCLIRFYGNLTQEHITPISLGGSHTVWNVVPACQSCNSKKRLGPPLIPVQPLLLTFSK